MDGQIEGVHSFSMINCHATFTAFSFFFFFCDSFSLDLFLQGWSHSIVSVVMFPLEIWSVVYFYLHRFYWMSIEMNTTGDSVFLWSSCSSVTTHRYFKGPSLLEVKGNTTQCQIVCSLHLPGIAVVVLIVRGCLLMDQGQEISLCRHTNYLSDTGQCMWPSVDIKVDIGRKLEWEKKAQLQIHLLLQHHGQRNALINTAHTWATDITEPWSGLLILTYTKPQSDKGSMSQAD